ncbi:MAG: sugar phosphate isomerase/epimerase [Verrucomicrobia bacterium]|nr:sugar phosphate isomerase/epimerase [Verrucomicrobiota bacterium]
MNTNLTRRDFVKTSAAAGLGLWAAGSLDARAAFKTKLHKAMIRKKPSEKELQELKDAGFEGVEGGIVTVEEAAECRKIADKLGMRIHSVLRGWAEFNSEDPAKVESSLKVTEDALRAAHAFGADAVLLVPCKIGGKGMAMPEAWEFDIEFDKRTGHVKKVVAGDNEKYKDYIAAQNHATDTSRAAVKKLIPLAKQLKVVIALENVWNNLWVKPALFQNFVASFHNEWVKAYFDIGNHVKYQKPEDWIRALGPLIAKCHIKDFQLNPDGHGGKFVHPRDGSVNWPVVRQALEDVGYNGWLSIEDGGLTLKEFNDRLDLIIAGK